MKRTSAQLNFDYAKHNQAMEKIEILEELAKLLKPDDERHQELAELKREKPKGVARAYAEDPTALSPFEE